LDLLHLITNEKNIESIVKEMLNYILISEADFLQELTLKVFIFFSLRLKIWMNRFVQVLKDMLLIVVGMLILLSKF